MYLCTIKKHRPYIVHNNSKCEILFAAECVKDPVIFTGLKDIIQNTYYTVLFFFFSVTSLIFPRLPADHFPNAAFSRIPVR